MKTVYFAGPVSINPQKATRKKKRFLEANWDVLEEQDVTVVSPHLLYKWLTDLPENTGRGSRPEKYALRSCLSVIEEMNLDALLMLTRKDEESRGMREEREIAVEKDIPVYNLPYFSTKEDVLTVNGVTTEQLRDVVRRIDGESI